VNPERLLDELVGAARKLGVDVRIETLRVPVHHATGGLCRLRGKPVVLLDNRSPMLDRVLTLAEALGSLAQASEQVYMAPEARELIENARAKRDGRIPAAESRAVTKRVLGTPKPGIRKARSSRR
jgi:hypothetical protein